jgi:hypothetical protein
MPLAACSAPDCVVAVDCTLAETLSFLSLGLVVRHAGTGAERERHFTYESLGLGISELVVHLPHRPDSLVTHPDIDDWLQNSAINRNVSKKCRSEWMVYPLALTPTGRPIATATFWNCLLTFLGAIG